MKSEAETGRGVTVSLLLLLLASMLVIPAVVGGASAAVPNNSSPPFRGHPPMNSGYDEQIGLTFTQNFTSMSYNVTAVEQTDPTLGTGPGYLLSGLTTSGYWYQVGLSYDWSPGAGFAMSYEVFNPSAQSIYPVSGGGGLTGFSGPINPGDNVTITLYFSSGDVIMAAMDTSTGASAQESYTAQGATQFVGQPNGDANNIGFFTGLMTEWYHGEPYYTNEAEVLYTTNTPLSSGWMWMDEFNAGNGQLVFSSNATTVTTYSSSSQLQEYSYQGITEYSSGTAFVTGALSGSTTTTGTTTGTSTVTSTVTSTDTVSADAQTVTVTSTSTVTQPVTTTVTTTTPSTVTDTTTSTVPTTQTVTQNLTSTATQTLTQTLTTTVASIPLWVYALMGLVLLGGLALGYLIRRPSPTVTPAD